MTRLALALLLLCSAGCKMIPLPPPGPTEGRAWYEARHRWSRYARLYDRFETRAFLAGAYQSPELRQARVDQVAEWRAMTAPERQKLQEAEAADQARYEEFLVSMYTPDPKDNDLDQKGSIWRVALVVQGEAEALPAEVRILTADMQLRNLYPFVGDFDVVYRVRFPRWPGAPLHGRRFLLRVAGSAGQMELDFSDGVPGSAPPEHRSAP